MPLRKRYASGAWLTSQSCDRVEGPESAVASQVSRDERGETRGEREEREYNRAAKGRQEA